MSVTDIKRPTSMSDVSASSVFCRGKLNVVIYSHPHTKVSVLPIQDNPKRKTLFRETGRKGLCVFYYTDNIECVYISVHGSFVRLQRDQLYQIHKALRRFTKNVKPILEKNPGKEFKEYQPPEEQTVI